MTYYNDLAAELRARKCTEPQVLDILREVREAGGEAPEQEFGPAAQYAQNYTGSRRFSPAGSKNALAVALAVVVLVVLRVTVFPGLAFFPWGLVLGVAVFVVVGVAVDLAARRRVRRMPAGF